MMRKAVISMFFVVVSMLFICPTEVFAKEVAKLPEAVEGIITLEEDLELTSTFMLKEDVVIDLNNHTLTLTKPDNFIYADVEIIDGTLDVSNITGTGDAIIRVGNYGYVEGNLSLENVTFTGDNYSSAWCVVYVYGTNTLNITDSVLKFSNENSITGAVIKAEKGQEGKINIINSTLDFENTVRAMQDGTILIKDSTVSVRGTKAEEEYLNNAFNTTKGGLALTFDNTQVEITNASGRAITLDDTTLSIINGSVITVTNCLEGEIFAKASGGAITSDSTSTINAEVTIASSPTGTIEITGGKYSTDVTAFIKDDYIYRVVDGLYVVSKNHDVVVTAKEEGTVETNVNSAFVGDTVTITPTAKTGYYVSKIVVTDEKDNEITVANNSFIMPESGVNVDVVFMPYLKTVDAPILDPTKAVSKASMGVMTLSKIRLILLDELDKSKIDTTNKNVSVVVKVENTDPESTVKENFTNRVKKESENLKITDYFDISLVVKNTDTDEELATLDELSKEIELSILLPEELQNKDSNYTRKYYVIREHNGQMAFIRATVSEDGESLSFGTDSFSTYALAYEDVKNEEITNTPTGDNITSTLAVAVISLMGALGSCIYFKKIN